MRTTHITEAQLCKGLLVLIGFESALGDGVVLFTVPTGIFLFLLYFFSVGLTAVEARRLPTKVYHRGHGKWWSVV